MLFFFLSILNYFVFFLITVRFSINNCSICIQVSYIFCAVSTLCLLPSAEGDDDTSFSKDVLKEQRSLFLDELEPTEVADYLFQFGVLDLDCHDKVEKLVPRMDRTRQVLLFLERRSPVCFNIFLHVLKLSNQQHILSMLQEREESTSMTPKREDYVFIEHIF